MAHIIIISLKNAAAWYITFLRKTCYFDVLLPMEYYSYIGALVASYLAVQMNQNYLSPVPNT
jgi:hypothetical protein